MTDHPNAQLLRDVYAAFGRGDVETASKYWTEDAVHHYPGRSELAGSHRGLDSTQQFAQRMFELTGGNLSMEVTDIGASDGFGYARLYTRYQRGDRILEMPFVNVARVEDGRIAEFWTFPEDQYKVDEFWS
jgi:ketosteroid isomerase-like protein